MMTRLLRVPTRASCAAALSSSIAVALVALIANSVTAEDRQSELVKRGRELLEKKDYRQAFDALTEAIRSALGQKDEAAKKRQRCLRLARSKSPSEPFLGELLAAVVIAMQLGNDQSRLADDAFVSGPKPPGAKPEISSAMIHWRRGHALATIALEHSVHSCEVGMPRMQLVSETQHLASGLPSNHPLHAQIEQMREAMDPQDSRISPPMFIRRE